jgi:hypothetical protein
MRWMYLAVFSVFLTSAAVGCGSEAGEVQGEPLALASTGGERAEAPRAGAPGRGGGAAACVHDQCGGNRNNQSCMVCCQSCAAGAADRLNQCVAAGGREQGCRLAADSFLSDCANSCGN